MTIDLRLAFGASAAALLLGLVLGLVLDLGLDLALCSAAFAQDSMQLDTMFRESLSQGRDAQANREEGRPRVQGRRYEGRDVDHRQDAKRRSAQRRNDEGR